MPNIVTLILQILYVICIAGLIFVMIRLHRTRKQFCKLIGELTANLDEATKLKLQTIKMLEETKRRAAQIAKEFIWVQDSPTRKC